MQSRAKLAESARYNSLLKIKWTTATIKIITVYVWAQIDSRPEVESTSIKERLLIAENIPWQLSYSRPLAVKISLMIIKEIVIEILIE